MFSSLNVHGIKLQKQIPISTADMGICLINYNLVMITKDVKSIQIM